MRSVILGKFCEAGPSIPSPVPQRDCRLRGPVCCSAEGPLLARYATGGTTNEVDGRYPTRCCFSSSHSCTEVCAALQASGWPVLRADWMPAEESLHVAQESDGRT